MKKHFIFFLILISSLSLFSQRGKDGAGNIVAANTIVNLYTPLTASINAGATSISVGSTVGFAVGDLVMIIQMQGASVRANKWWFTDTTATAPPDTSQGYILNYNEAGNHEFAQVNSVLSANSLSLDCGILKKYTTVGKTQVIRVPRYTTLLVNGGFITCPAWNGSVGGVTAVEAVTSITLSSTPAFNVVGKGFRGGGVENLTAGFANKFGSIKPVEGAYKGEGIGGDTNTYKSFSGVFCRGAIANAGGGGDSENAGGGGGANGGVTAAYVAVGNPPAGYNAAWNLEAAGFFAVTSSGGGRGGYTSSTNNQNPNTVAPGSASWAADERRNVGGFGGRPLDYSTGKIFVGGGGGTGDSNDGKGAPGGNGGGMVYMICYGDLSGAGTINADGAVGGTSAGTCGSADGASGGGGGGTIILNIGGITNLTASPALFARGGVGGNNSHGVACFNTQAMGPGGGGGGGYIGYTGTLPLNAITGGANGIVIGNLSSIAANFPPNGATIGGAGSSGTLQAVRTITATASTTICVNNSTTLNAVTTATSATINWYSTIAGGSPIASGPVLTTSVFSVPGTYTLFAGYCDAGTYRVPSVITVITGPTLTVNSPSICAGQTVTLTGNGATTYTWNTGPNTATIAVSPTTTTTYTISGTVATCSSNLTSTVTVTAAPSITAAPISICNGQTTTITASGATTYTWNTGPTTASIAVSPTTTTAYTVTGSNGSCTSVRTTTVTVNALPAVTSTSANICAGQSTTLTAGGATTYTWNTGPTTSTIALSPIVTTNYTVTGSNGTCSNTQTTSITIAPLPTVTASSGTICSGQQLILTAGGATTYTWNTGPTTSTVAVTPTATTNYTVTGSNGTCSNTQTTSVTVNSLPIVTANSPTLCSGQTATLIASGASTYTWSPGPFVGGTVTVSPGITQIYTVTGTSPLACQGTNTTTVSVTATPTLVAPSATICPGNTATLTVSGATTYTWNPGGSTGTTYTASPPTTTVYTVTGTNGACASTQTVAITIGSAISIVVNNPNICTGGTATLTASGAATYTWSTGSNSASITITPTATTVYTINGTSSACTGMNTSTVTVNALPTITSATTAICSGQTATLTASGASTYTWNPGGLSGGSVTVSPTSSQNYTVIGNSVAGCTNSAATSVSVMATPTLVAPSTTICTGGTGTLTASGATTYTWNPGNATGSTFTASPASSTNYTLTGATGICASTTTVDISVGAALSISINSPTICAGQSVTLTATGSATTYTWNTGGNTNTIVVTPTTTTSYTVNASSGVCNGTGTTSVLVNALPSVTVAGSAICSGQTVTLTASGATNYTWMPSGTNGTTYTDTPIANTTYSVTGTTSGCGNTATFDVTVTPTPSLTVNSPTICGGSTTLTAIGATNYTWSPGAQTTSSIVVSPTVTTSYTINGANGSCLSSATAIVNVNSAPPLIINMMNPSPFCPGSCSNFSTTTGYNGVMFDYGDATGTTTATTHCYAGSGTYTVTASATYSSGCSLVTNTIVNVSFLPIATATFGINNGTSFSVGTNVSFNNFSVTGNWSFGDGSAVLTNTMDPSHIFSTPGNYCVKLVTITSTLSCADSITKCLDIIQPVSIVIPNVFTPNGDGSNDVFKASGTGITTFHCVIFDRWGLRMYEWDGIGGGWDGYTKAGSQASTGTYYYIIEYKTADGKAAVVKNFLSLFKD